MVEYNEEAVSHRRVFQIMVNSYLCVIFVAPPNIIIIYHHTKNSRVLRPNPVWP